MQDQGQLPDLTALRESQRRGLCPRCAAELPESGGACTACAMTADDAQVACASCGASMRAGELFCSECLAVSERRVVVASGAAACTRCGAKNPDGAERCGACWARVAGEGSMVGVPPEMAPGDDAGELAEAPAEIAMALQELEPSEVLPGPLAAAPAPPIGTKKAAPASRKRSERKAPSSPSTSGPPRPASAARARKEGPAGGAPASAASAPAVVVTSTVTATSPSVAEPPPSSTAVTRQVEDPMASGAPAAPAAASAPRVEEVRTQNDPQRTCPLCGYENASTAEFCGACWARMSLGGGEQPTRLRMVVDPELAERWEVHGVRTGFVGRAQELSALCQIFDDVHTRRLARLVTVVGDPGIGKSRLFGALESWLREHGAGVRVLTAACREDETQASLGAMARILRERFGLREHDAALEAREKLRRETHKTCAGPFAADVAATLERFLALPPIGEGEGEGLAARLEPSPVDAPRVEEGAGREQVRAESSTGPGIYRVWGALARFFEGDSREGPLVVCIDDAHQASPELLTLVRHLAGTLEDAPVLFVVLARPDLLVTRPEWIEPAGAHVRIDLGPLSTEESVRLVEGIISKLGFDAEAVSETVRRGDGSPLFLEELCRIALEEGPKTTGGGPLLPGSVDDAVRRRISFLSPRARALLEKAAVIGRTFWLGALVALERLDRGGFTPPTGDTERYWFGTDEGEEVRRHLEELRARDFISRNPNCTFPDEEEYLFKQSTERDLVYGEVALRRSAPWHRVVSQWLLQRRGGSDDARFAQAARHRELAGDTQGAARLYLGAADRARNVAEPERCAELYERGLALLPPQEVATRLHVLHGLGDALARSGNFDGSLRRFREMLRCAWLLGERAKGGAAYNRIGRIHRHLGRYDAAMAALSDGHTLFLEARDWRGVSASLDDIGQVHRLRGEFEQAVYHFQEALQLRRELGDPRGIALSLYNLGELQRDAGRLREAEVNLDEGLRLIRQTSDRVGISALLSALGTLVHEKGDVARAKALWDEALSLARDAGDRDAEGKILARMGELAMSGGEHERARALLAEAVDLVRGLEDRAHLSALLRSYAEAQLKAGDGERAMALGDEALKLARELGNRLDEGGAHRVLGEVHAQTLFDDTAHGVALRSQAEEHFDTAVQIFEALGNDLELGRTLTSYGNYLLEHGRLERGRAELMRARDLLGRREASRSLARAERTIDKLP